MTRKRKLQNMETGERINYPNKDDPKLEKNKFNTMLYNDDNIGTAMNTGRDDDDYVYYKVIKDENGDVIFKEVDNVSPDKVTLEVTQDMNMETLKDRINEANEVKNLKKEIRKTYGELPGYDKSFTDPNVREAINKKLGFRTDFDLSKIQNVHLILVRHEKEILEAIAEADREIPG